MNGEVICLLLSVVVLLGEVLYLVMAVLVWLEVICDSAVIRLSRKEVDWLNTEGKNGEDMCQRGQSPSGDAHTVPEGERASAQP